LLGDLDRHISEDSSETVSLKRERSVTTCKMYTEDAKPNKNSLTIIQVFLEVLVPAQ
jgi:hypothetical protein